VLYPVSVLATVVEMPLELPLYSNASPVELEYAEYPTRMSSYPSPSMSPAAAS